MAPENAESVSDASAHDAQQDTVPDSRPLRVSLDTQFESGIPPARAREQSALERGVERTAVALTAVTRTEAHLGLLISGLEHLAAGAQAAREANTELTNQLAELRSHLMRKNEAEHTLHSRLGQLEDLLDVVRHEGSREREFLIEQQDLFLVEILTDHERQVADLTRALSESGPRSSDARQRELEELLLQRDELTAQRDQAREYATRCEHERDAAWSELAISESTPAPVTVHRYATPPPLNAQRSAEPEVSSVADAELAGSRRSNSTPIGSLTLRPGRAPASHVSSTNPEHVSRTNHEHVSGSPGTRYSLSGEDISD